MAKETNANPYQEVKLLTEFYQSSGIMPEVKTFLSLLAKHGIKPSIKGGDVEITLSVPEGDGEEVIVGLEYEDSKGEHDDLYIFSKGKPVQTYKRIGEISSEKKSDGK